MKILLYRTNGLGENGIKNALKKLGHIVESLIYVTKNFDYDKELLNRLIAKTQEFEPDIIMSVDFFPIVSKVCQVFKKIYISWVYDCPELRLFSKAVTNPCNRIFIFDLNQYHYFKPYNPSCIFYKQLATEPLNKEYMSKIMVSERKAYSHEICFIGSLYNEKSQSYQRIKNLPEYWAGYIDGIVGAQCNVSGYNMISDSLTDYAVGQLRDLLKYELVDDYERDDRYVIDNMYIGPYCSSRDREKTLKFISDRMPVALYTGEDSDVSMLPNIKNMGIAYTDTMMPKIFHCSKINLNITSKTIQTGIPLRVFDVLGCQGFLITNYQEELFHYFEPGEDLIVYENIEDLYEKCLYYLEHEDERQQIALNGYKKIIRNYTYEIVIKEMFDEIGIN